MHLNIELTGKCNQHCAYCSNPIRTWNELTAAQWLSKIRESGAQSVHLTGGEPLLYKELVPFLEDLYTIGINVSILSNGSVPKIVSQNRSLFEQLDVVQISIDSTNPLIHDQRRGFDGAHKRAGETIRLLMDSNVPVEISMVVDSETFSGIPSMIRYCRKIGAKLILRPLAKIGSSNDSFDFTDRSLLDGANDVVAHDRFGYGAKSIGAQVLRPTLDPTGKLIAA